ncbi:Outer membrane protein beta-barrel domain-containing protein [Sphingobacterium nematocida]|uniref:Outer membrane protein beta-barrel domain-containing protein n=1 Tax=Sphingobacterium nematocida TaxID=1513896 RepID=A0A1T5FV86_9SPHI|nr:porin family protein [Sphingobacterium nematocida]SKC00076.1 Outer membrane protein beta-barrel domain-containing protein [Sphingobacterium nematocida]
MKKVLLTLGVALLTAVGAQAQVSYGLKAGVNLGKFSNVPDAVKDYQKNNTSFYVTGFADLPVASQFSIQPGISLQGKGEKFKYDGNNLDGSSSTNLMSIEIPVNAVYYIPTGSSGSVFLGAGPYVGFNVSGKDKWDGTTPIGSASGDSDVKFGSADDETKRVEAGANFMAGYKLSNGFLINAGYGLGLTALNNSGDSRSNRVLSFGVGFQF